MKYIFFLFFVPFIAIAQQSANGQIWLSFEGKAKKDVQKKIDNYSASLPEVNFNTTKSWSVLLKYNFKKHFSFETGFHRDEFNISWNIEDGYIGSKFFMYGNLIPLRVQYEIPIIKIKKRWIVLQPTCGYLFGWNGSYNIEIGGGVYTQSSLDGKWVFTNYFREGKEYKLSRTFGLVEMGGAVRLTISKTLSLYGGGGYSIGVRPLAYANIKVAYQGQQIAEVKNKNSGSHYFYKLGLCFNLGTPKMFH